MNQRSTNSSVEIEPISAAPPHRVSHPVMLQSWSYLTFLHWPYEPAAIKSLIPSELNLDLYDRAAWVGLVPFVVTKLRIPGTPALPRLSTFPETNVRTYVTDRQGRRGVWFFSLDAARPFAVLGARAFYALPYFWAKMKVNPGNTDIHYSSSRHGASGIGSRIQILPGEPVTSPSTLEVFLTARFRLYARRCSRIIKADIEHPPWELQRGGVIQLEENLVRAAGLPEPQVAPLVHFARHVDVKVATPVRVE